MTRDEFIQLLANFPNAGTVKQYQANSPADYTFEIYADIETKRRTQSIRVTLEGDDVIAFSRIGICPTDSETLLRLLEENVSCRYSRLCLMKSVLVQLYKYALEELEGLEFCQAIDEVATFADFCENKYFGGADIT